MSPNLEQPQDSPSPSSETSEAGVGVPCPDPRQEQPWPRQTRPKSSPGGRLGRRGSAGWEEALVVADVEEEEVGAVGGVGWRQEAHSWGQDTAHAGVRGAHDDADDDEAGWAEGGPVATVKLVLETGVGVITRAWALNQPLHALRTQLSHTTQVPAQYVQLVLRGRMLGDEATLRGVGVEANETVQVGVSSKRPHTHPLTLLAPTSPPLPTPDVITVIVAEGGGVEREVVVEVEWASGPKVWLGGFRHKLSGLHYHNAATQTLATTRPAPGRVTRGSQTVWARTRGTQTRRHAHTQTTTLHPLLVTPTPTIITPRPYVPARHYDVAKVVMVQKIVRGFLGRRRATRMARVRLAAASCTRRVSEAGSEEQRLAVTVSSPSTEEDLDSDQQRREWLVPLTQLYARLENWRRRQVALVTETLTGRERRAALVALLDKETELLRALEAHRGIRTARRRNAAVAHFLQEVARPQVWAVSGRVGGVEVETPDTHPIRTLAALATALTQDATPEVRAHHLHTLTATVANHQGVQGAGRGGQRVAGDLQRLAGRGISLLARGTSDARLRGLRKRLHGLILTYLQEVQSRVPPVVTPRTVRAAGARPVLQPTRLS
ncbi:IQ and ubiquitin-like domain-containing protein [Portunus trituberculatus]|uniref:IQ and ubiquitin-like domain-containing protein n=1 Tax=Portunus trituberculatus TaxID=210409 RepID=UPI001E1CBBDA|nr:IQ and ubiquitin-like domain-containing protein [Portunus trituberculatus]